MTVRLFFFSTVVALCAGCPPHATPLSVAQRKFARPHPKLISSNDSWSDAEPDLCTDGRGTLLSAWLDFEAPRQASINYALSHDDGDTWTAPQRLDSPGGRTIDQPTVATDGQGRFYLTFLAKFRPRKNQHVYFSIWEPGAPGFSEPMELSGTDGGPMLDRPRVAVDNGGRVLVAWRQMDLSDGTDRLLIARSEDGGKTFSLGSVASSEDTVGGSPFICEDRRAGDRAPIFLANVNGERIVLHRSNDHGATWSMISQPASDAAWHGPNCVVRGKDIWVSYDRDDYRGEPREMVTGLRVTVHHAPHEGEDFAGPVIIAEGPPGTEYEQPALTLTPSGHLASLFVFGERGSAGGVGLARSVDDGRTWTRTTIAALATFPILHSHKTWTGDYLGVALSDRFLYVAYGDNSSGTSRIMFQRFGDL